MIAIQGGHDGIVTQLLATGKVDVNQRDRKGHTALWRAAECNRRAILSQLLAIGEVDLSIKDKEDERFSNGSPRMKSARKW